MGMQYLICSTRCHQNACRSFVLIGFTIKNLHWGLVRVVNANGPPSLRAVAIGTKIDEEAISHERGEIQSL